MQHPKTVLGTPLSKGGRMLTGEACSASPVLPSTAFRASGCPSPSQMDGSFSIGPHRKMGGSVRSYGMQNTKGQGQEALKAARRESLKNVVKYLTTHGYKDPISVKMLMSSPSRQTFLAVMLFLMQKIDPTIIEFVKPDDEIPRYCKEIGYPTTVNRTSMIAPCAPNTWQQHLSLIEWMCELLSAAENHDEVDGDSTPIPSSPSPLKTKSNFSNDLEEALMNEYSCSDSSDNMLDDEIRKLSTTATATYSSQWDRCNSKLMKVDEEISGLNEKLERGNLNSKRMEELQELKKSFASTYSIFNEKLNLVHEETKQWEAKEQRLQPLVDTAKRDAEETENKVKTQEMSMDDVEHCKQNEQRSLKKLKTTEAQIQRTINSNNTIKKNVRQNRLRAVHVDIRSLKCTRLLTTSALRLMPASPTSKDFHLVMHTSPLPS
eukprot:GHVO01049455.1.p1 GENE.GHVO01049455.1~~GHVO01049455.1.p1  ORF type:complete len:442 (+),score=63.44 GHVO01049455.1:26-1327(+)